MDSTLLGLAIMAVPVVFAVLMLLIARTHRRVARAMATVPSGWVPATGLVVDEVSEYIQSTSNTVENHTAFVRTPIVRYRTAQGHDVTFRSGLKATFMPRPGTSVMVYHDPADPNRARLAPESIPRANKRAFSAAWVLMGVLYVPFAAMFGFIGLIVLGT